MKSSARNGLTIEARTKRSLWCGPFSVVLTVEPASSGSRVVVDVSPAQGFMDAGRSHEIAEPIITAIEHEAARG